MRLPLLYGDQEVTLTCPLTQTTIAPTTPVINDQTTMQQIIDPFPFGKPWWYPYYPGVPATLPPREPLTTTSTPFQYPIQQHQFPYMYPNPIFDPYFYSNGDPTAPPAQQQQQPQHPWYPKFPPYMQQYQGYPMNPLFYGYPPKPFVSPTVKYPFMPQYPKDPIFVPRKRKFVFSPAQLSSIYRSRK